MLGGMTKALIHDIEGHRHRVFRLAVEDIGHVGTIPEHGNF